MYFKDKKLEMLKVRFKRKKIYNVMPFFRVHNVFTHKSDVYTGNTSSIKKLSAHSMRSLERYYCSYYQVDMR